MNATYNTKQKTKAYYIPLVAAGKLSIRKAALLIGIQPVSVWRLKNRYIESGESVFIRASKGHPSYHQIYSDQFKKSIIKIYYEHWEGCPYKTFWRALQDYHSITIPYNSLRMILKEFKIKSMRERKPKEKIMHPSRKERLHEGELIQMDASKHDWFMNGFFENIHGAIDDATHKITGLYMCENECRLGYNEVLRQTFQNNGIPSAVYIDRHSSFVSTPKVKKEKLQYTLAERIQKEKDSNTHFNDLCEKLNIQVILALSAQGKGRIERLWQTLQGILPFYFRYLKINNCQDANIFLSKWKDFYNTTFSIDPKEEKKAYRNIPKWFNPEYDLSLKFHKRTNREGCFIFHDFEFCIKADIRSCRNFELLLSEQFGIKALMDGKYYDVELLEPLVSIRGDRMPIVEKELISRYLLQDLHNDYAV